MLKINLEKPIIDLSNVELNRLQYLYVKGYCSYNIKESDFEFGTNLINPMFTKSISLSISQLPIIPSNVLTIFQNLSELSILNGYLKQIPRGIFAEKNQLVSLTLNKCEIDSIEADAFINLKYLEKLNLDINQLKRLNKRIFSGLENLKEFTANQNKISSIDNDTFDSLVQLVKLELKSNEIGKINLDKLINLEHLDLKENGFLLDVKPQIFTKLSKLKNFYFS